MADTALSPDRHSEMSVVAFDERTRRVMELRRQIKEGTYQADARSVALAMMQQWERDGDLSEQAAPAVSTPAERRATARDRFVVAPRIVESDEERRKAI